MIVYRIESLVSILATETEGNMVSLGPYIGFEDVVRFHHNNEQENHILQKMIKYHNEGFTYISDAHPKPDNRQMDLMIYENCVCGFDSIDQLKKWFSKTELEFLEKHFGVFVYDCDALKNGHYRSNDFQVVFALVDSEVKSFIPISDLL